MFGEIKMFKIMVIYYTASIHSITPSQHLISRDSEYPAVPSPNLAFWGRQKMFGATALLQPIMQ